MKKTLLTMAFIAAGIAGLPAANAATWEDLRQTVISDQVQKRTVGMPDAPLEITIVGDLSMLRTRLEIIEFMPFVIDGEARLTFVPVTLSANGAKLGAKFLANKSPRAFLDYMTTYDGMRELPGPDGDPAAVRANTTAIRALGLPGVPLVYYPEADTYRFVTGLHPVHNGRGGGSGLEYPNGEQTLVDGTYKVLKLKADRLNLLYPSQYQALASNAGADSRLYQEPKDRANWPEVCGLNSECWKAPPKRTSFFGF